MRGLDRGVEQAFATLTDDFGVGDLVSLRFWISLITLLLVLMAFVVKWAIIDILWPVYFGLVTMMGGLAIPLSFIPGIETMRGWFLTLIEAALWPVVFQVVVAIMAGTIGHGLDEPLRLATEELQFAPLIESMATLATLTLLSLGTPVIAARLMRGQTAGDLFSRVASRAALLTTFVGAGLANAAAKRGVGGARAAAGAAAAAAPAAARVAGEVARGGVAGAAMKQAFGAAGMDTALEQAKGGAGVAAASPAAGDRRFYNPPGWKADEAREYNAMRREGRHDEAAQLKADIAQRKAQGQPPSGRGGDR